MPMGTNDARLKLTSEEEAKLITMDHNQMIAYMHELEVAKGLTVPDSLNGSVFHEITPVETAPASQDVHTVTINGKTITGSQEVIDAAMRAHFTEQRQDDQPARGADGRFKKETQRTAEEEAAAVADRAELELKFKRGEIDTSTYLEQTGAIAEALEKQLGVPIEAIAETFQEQAGRIYEQSWAEATTRFKESAEGRTWPGGNANMKKLGEVMTTTEVDGVLLSDLPDKTQALRLAYGYMQENKLLVAGEREEILKTRLAAAKTPEEVQEILGINERRVARQTSAQWGK